MTEKFVAYYRVSTTKQGVSGLGLDAQRAAVSVFVTGRDLIAEFTEIESGTIADRPELAKAMAFAKKNKATLVIAKLDRLARNVAFIANLMESGVDFVAAECPNATAMELHIRAVFAEEEARQISARTKAAMAAAKARGVRLGSPCPWKGGSVAKVAQKRKADRFALNVRPIIREIQSTGATTLQKVADALNARGIPTARGGNWYPGTVRSALERVA